MNFNFPFDPWPIQEEFMKQLFDCLDHDKIGIFSSPTGTGKSLSMICAALTWQTNFKQEIDLQGLDNEPDWVKAFALSKSLKDLKGKRIGSEIVGKSKKMRDDTFHQKIDSGNPKVSIVESSGRVGSSKSIESAELKYLVDEYESDKEKDSISRYLDNDQENEVLQEEMQVFYCSRTHSQLSQFIKEVNKTVFNKVKAVVIGSRKSTCINQDVLKLKSLTRINDACLDLQKNKVKCKYYSEFAANKNSFVKMAHDSVKDIEELAELGRQVQQCSYYGSREAIKSSQLIVVPYNLILQKSARESLGINLKNKVVIFDEAHNLIDAISGIYSVIVEKSVIERAKAQLEVYLQRYKSRLSGKNLIYIKQIQTLLDCFLRHLKEIEKQNDKVESILTVNDFVHDLGIDNLNLFKIEKYLKESRLAQKLNGFVVDLAPGPEKGQTVGSGEHFIPKHVSSLQQVQAFLMSLTNSEVDGRILVKRNEKNELAYRYVLLNPAGSFKDIVDDAKSVILAGGTMDPIQDFISQLYPHIPKDRLVHFSCGHVVPKSSLLTLCIGSRIDGSEFLFNNENKSNKNQIINLGKMMEEYSQIIPGGIVVFFSSYAYLDLVYSVWKESGSLSRIGSKKKVFIEPQGSSECDKILKSYEQHIISHRKTPYSGSILLAVVGGKVSEGINFSDDLGRAVFVIGLPYPNLGSIELQEKLKYLKNGSQEYYENLCIRAVNQSIGRAIRHIKDYSSIILIDSRWSGKMKKKLPEWILTGNIYNCDHQTSLWKITNFFKEKLRI